MLRHINGPLSFTRVPVYCSYPFTDPAVSPRMKYFPAAR